MEEYKRGGKRMTFDIKIKLAVLETILIPALNSFIGEEEVVEREKQTFKCEVCSVSTKSELYLKLHVRMVHEVEELKCDSCSYKAIDKNKLVCFQMPVSRRP